MFTSPFVPLIGAGRAPWLTRLQADESTDLVLTDVLRPRSEKRAR